MSVCVGYHIFWYMRVDTKTLEDGEWLDGEVEVITEEET